MSLINCNGFPVISGELRLPRFGIATGDLTVDTTQDLQGQVTIATDDGSFSLVGQAYRHGQFIQKQILRWVAGADGFETVLPPKQYRGRTLRSTLVDTLEACGETLSSTSDSTLLVLFLTNWVRLSMTAKAAVYALLEAQNAQGFRVLPDGTIWVSKTEPWPASDATIPFQIMTWERGEGWALLGCEQPFLLPGTTIQMDDGSGNVSTQKISYVVHSITAESVRTKIYFEDVA